MGDQCLLSVLLWVGLLAPDLGLVMEHGRFRDQGFRLVWLDGLLCFSCNTPSIIDLFSCNLLRVHRHSLYFRFLTFHALLYRVASFILITYITHENLLSSHVLLTLHPVAINCVRHQQT